MRDILTVRMLGSFSIEFHEKSIDDSSNRMKKVWLLLAYLIYARNQRVTQESLQNLLNGNSSTVRLEKYLEALELYKGDFLTKLSMEDWVMPISVYYHEMYLRVVEETLLLLEDAEGWTDGIALCEKALKIEPYSESLYQHLMRCKIFAGDRAGAQLAYEEMSEILFSNFGVMPAPIPLNGATMASRRKSTICRM